MTNIKEAAAAYVAKTSKNISELEKVSVELELEQRIGHEGDKEKEYTYNVTLIDKEEYRVPDSVLKQLKVLLERFPDMKEFSVMKEGEGLTGTKYSVIPMGV